MEGTTFTLTSAAFNEEEFIPLKHSLYGENISPELKWTNVPAETKSLALTMMDPDTPIGELSHWLLKDIPPSTTGFAEGSFVGTPVPTDCSSFPSIEFEGKDKFAYAGKKTYSSYTKFAQGPKPPSGTHRYFFTLYALNIETFEATEKDSFRKKCEEHKIGQAQLMGKYSGPA
jgi:Raf kinase inhibitor-like YbhB/YbcL family protein